MWCLEIKLNIDFVNYIVTCYLVTRQIICGFWIIYIDLLDKSSRGIYNYNTLKLTVITLR
jgi:hypothetical protein